MAPSPQPDYLSALDKVITEVIAPQAAEIDRTAKFPRPAVEALGQAGLLGLLSATEVGGMGQIASSAVYWTGGILLACLC